MQTVNSSVLTFSQRFCVLPPPVVRVPTQMFSSPTEHSEVSVSSPVVGSTIIISVQLVTVTRLPGLPSTRAFTAYSVNVGVTVGSPQLMQLSDVIGRWKRAPVPSHALPSSTQNSSPDCRNILLTFDALSVATPVKSAWTAIM